MFTPIEKALEIARTFRGGMTVECSFECALTNRLTLPRIKIDRLESVFGRRGNEDLLAGFEELLESFPRVGHDCGAAGGRFE